MPHAKAQAEASAELKLKLKLLVTPAGGRQCSLFHKVRHAQNGKRLHNFHASDAANFTFGQLEVGRNP